MCRYEYLESKEKQRKSSIEYECNGPRLAKQIGGTIELASCLQMIRLDLSLSPAILRDKPNRKYTEKRNYLQAFIVMLNK